MHRLFISLSLSLTLFTACEKNDEPEYNTTAKSDLSVEFDHVVDGSNLLLNTANYTNALGQAFRVTKLKYYVSNFAFTRTDGSVYTVPQNESYFLIDESKLDSRFAAFTLPEGEYKTVSFLLGVDSLRNTADVSLRTGVLDVSGPAADMYWTWNSGYIFFALEGTSPAITGMGGAFQYHVGGFGGYNTPTKNNLRTVSIDLQGRGTAKVKSGRRANVHLLVDVLKAISGTTNYNFATTPMIHSSAAGEGIANNYTRMFTHDHTEN